MKEISVTVLKFHDLVIPICGNGHTIIIIVILNTNIHSLPVVEIAVNQFSIGIKNEIVKILV